MNKEIRQVKSALEFSGVSFSYNSRFVIKSFSLTFSPGVFSLIIGPNGSGKTTLLKLAALLLRPHKGAISIWGKDIKSIPRKELARLISYVPQETPFVYQFSVEELVLMGRYAHLGLFEQEKRKDFMLADQAMELLDVAHLRDRRFHELSGGERQRAVIAMAICQETGVILLDEPTSSLDPFHQVEIMGILKRLSREKGITVISTSHDLDLASMFAEEIVLLKDGDLIKKGKPEDTLNADMLEKVYGCPFYVDRHPLIGSPRINFISEEPC
jgi:iron complex transport system ATP-binding protein